jgi:hypothetical protein
MSNLHSTIPICRGVADSLAAPRCLGQNPNMAALMNDLWRAALLAALGSLALATPRARADEWPKTPSQALTLERSDRMPPTSFYDTPSPLPPGAPGELIRSQVAIGYALPEGVRAVRIRARTFPPPAWCCCRPAARREAAGR